MKLSTLTIAAGLALWGATASAQGVADREAGQDRRAGARAKRAALRDLHRRRERFRRGHSQIRCSEQ